MDPSQKKSSRARRQVGGDEGGGDSRRARRGGGGDAHDARRRVVGDARGIGNSRGAGVDAARARVSGWVGVDVSTDTSSISRVERTRISPFVAFAVVAAARRAAAFAAARAFRLSRGVVVAAVLVDSESEVWYPTSDPRRSRSSAEEWPDVADAAERSARAAASCRRLFFTSADSFSPPEPALARGRIEGGSRGSGGSGGAGEDDVAVAVVGRGTGGVDFCGA